MAVNAAGHGISEVQLFNSVAQEGAPSGTAVMDSANGSAEALTATLAAAAGETTYITGFSVTGAGATTGSTIEVTITGLATTLRYKLVVPSGATTSIAPIHVEFRRPVPASAVNTAIVVNVPSFGAGNLAAAVSATGIRA